MIRVSKTFIRSSLTYTLAGMLPMGSAIILLPFYITYLSTADFGALSIYFAFALFIQILTTYSFDTSVYIHFHEFKNDPKKLSAFVSSAFLLMLLIGLGAALIFIFSGDLIFQTIFSEKDIGFYPYGLMTAATGVFQALFKVHGNLLQSRERPEIFLWSNLTSFALIALFTVVGLKLFPGTLMGPVGGRLLAALLSGIWALSRIFREFGIHYDYQLLRSTFRFNFYTFIYQISQWVINYADRIIMLFFLSTSQVGIYDFSMKCMLVIEFILNGLYNSFYPKIVATVMQQDRKGSTPEINRYFHGFIAMIMVLVVASIFFFPVAIQSFVDKPGYSEAANYIPYIGLMYIFRALRLFYAAPYGILKFAQPLAFIHLGISAAKILAIIALVQWFAIEGVIIAGLISLALELVLLKQNVKDRFLFHYNVVKILYAPLSLLMLVLVAEPLVGQEWPVATHGFYVAFCGALLFWIYRNELKSIDFKRLIR